MTSSCLSKLGVGRSRPLEDLDLTEMPAWAYLDLTEDDVDPILNACNDRIKDSQDLAG